MPRVERLVKLAVSMEDLERLSPLARAGLTAGRLDLSRIVKVGEDRIKAVPALAFSCDLLTAAKVCDIMRAQDKKVEDKLTQVYVLKDRVWSRVPWNVTLTVARQNGDGRPVVQLNPDIFGQAVEPVHAPVDAVAPDDDDLRIKIEKKEWRKA